MIRLLGFTAIAFLGATVTFAQSDSRTGTYQSILSESYDNGYPGINAPLAPPVAPGTPDAFAATTHTGATVAHSCPPGTDFGSCYGPEAGYEFGPLIDDAPSDRNWFFGLNGLVFDRDYEDDVFITQAIPSGDILLSTDADAGTLGGLEFFLGSRAANGNGFEARYWGLFADEASATINGNAFSAFLIDVASLQFPGTGEDLLTIVNRSQINSVTRDNEIHNVEFNFLRYGGAFQTRFGHDATFEIIHGFRWFEFDEEFQWRAQSNVNPFDIRFDNVAQNTLLGYQLGSRSNVCLGRRLSINWTTKFGIFNNRARVSQQIFDQASGIFAQTPGGQNFNFSHDKNDLSLLGELDVALALNITNCSRINIGYRAIGVSGIALGPDQFSNFNTIAAITDVQANGDLILNGAYFGFEFCH